MSFIPAVVPPTPSPRARELGQRLAETIDSFCREHPDMSTADIGKAISLAATKADSRGQSIAFAVAAGLAILGALVAFYLASV